MTSLGRRAITTTPSRALVFINSPEVREMAEHFAKSIEKGTDPVGTASARALGRQPSADERKRMNSFLKEQTRKHGGNKQAALIDFCHALLAANEMIYVE